MVAYMRVLQVMAGAHVGGAEAFFERLTAGLNGAGVAQHLAIRRDAARAERLRDAGLTVDELAFGGPLDLFTRPAIARITRGFAPDVTLCWMNRAAAKTGRPKHTAVLAGRLGGYYALKYYARCDHLIANTPDIVRWIAGQGWPADRVHYVPNFVEERAGTPVDRAVLGTPADAPLFVALGRLHTAKAFDVAIEALADVPGAHLWIAGEGPEREALSARARARFVADRVRFLGWRADAPDLLATADAALVPSRHEPLGNVVLEAWAHGAPVIAARAQGPAQLIEDGETGLLVPVDDARALSAAMRRVAGSAALRQDLSAAARAAHEARFSRAAVLASWRAFLDRALSAGPRA